MSNTTVSEAVARPLRTLPQGGAAWAVTEGIDAFFYDFNDRQFGILVVLLTMLFSFIQTTIENHKGKAFLRNVPPTKTKLTDTDSSPLGADDEPITSDEQFEDAPHEIPADEAVLADEPHAEEYPYHEGDVQDYDGEGRPL